MFTCFYIFKYVSWESRFRCYVGYKLYQRYMFQFIPGPSHYSEGRQNFSNCDWRTNETVTLRKHVFKYKNMRQWMVDFIPKFENRGIKIDRVNLILISKYFNLQLFIWIFYGVGVRCDVDIFKLTANAQSIYREVYGVP